MHFQHCHVCSALLTSQPESFGASAAQICTLKHVAVAILHRVQHDQVQVHRVAAIPVLSLQGVGASVSHLQVMIGIGWMVVRRV